MLKSITIGMKVKVKAPSTELEGVINSFANFEGTESLWWVDVIRADGVLECMLVSEQKLMDWNYGKVCQCGGDSVGATKHPRYCDKYED